MEVEWNHLYLLGVRPRPYNHVKHGAASEGLFDIIENWYQLIFYIFSIGPNQKVFPIQFIIYIYIYSYIYVFIIELNMAIAA